MNSSIAVLLPCLNEEAAIASVVRRVKTVVPDAAIYVYDNGSTDQTVNVARAAGAIVRYESTKGKGNVVRRMFADVEADVYVMVDGDGTYEYEAIPSMLALLTENHLDMVTGVRVEDGASTLAYRGGHRLGNQLFTSTLQRVFASDCDDVLSGFRVMTRRLVKSFPTTSRGFEIEVELTAHVSLLRLPTGHIETKYVERPVGSESKLNTYRDGLRIARRLFSIFRSYAPSRFFGSLSILSLLGAVSLLFGASRDESSGLSAFTVASGVAVVLSALFLSFGVILNALARQRVEALRLSYLSLGSSGRAGQ